MTPEGRVKKEIKAYLDSVGAYSFWPVQYGYGAATVDCLACVKGRFIAIEVKRPEGGKLTGRQTLTINKVAQANGRWVIATSVNDVKQALRGLV